MSSNTISSDLPVLVHSRYAKRLVHANPALLDWIGLPLIGLDEVAMSRFLDIPSIQDEMTLRRQLRLLRKIVMVQLIAGDVSNHLPLETVFDVMTQFADFVICETLRWLTDSLTSRYGIPQDSEGNPQSLVVISMGKLGSRELNVSSDVDLVFVYPEDGETSATSAITNDDFFTRLAKKLIHTLAEVTEEGFVFRVDMRLRPNGDAGPLVCSYAALENYFVTQGRDWERYAWLRARPITGSKIEHKELNQIFQPFVFKKYLDYGTLDAMRKIHREIQRKVLLEEMQNNIKHGPGGIREVEFVVQAFQLIHGGRIPQLRSKSILETLDLLSKESLLPLEEAEKLSRAYRFLRQLEHRLMYLDDAQTQDLPHTAEDQMLIAGSMGFNDYEAFMEKFHCHQSQVSKQFDQVFIETTNEVTTEFPLEKLWDETIDRQAAKEVLLELNYKEVDQIIDQLVLMRQGARYRRLNKTNRLRFDSIIPRAILLAAGRPEPTLVLGRTLALLETIIQHGAYLAMLKEHPKALEKMVQMTESSRWATDYLIQHPVLLDEMLDPRLLYEIPSWDDFRQSLTNELDQICTEDGQPDMEKQMDRMREIHHALIFRLLAQDLAKLLSVETLSDHLSLLADIMLEETLKRCWIFIRQRYDNCPEEPRFAVLGYGKLGGKELGYASDLDLVFIYDDLHVEAGDIYTKYVQRINSWLSTTTVTGKLFDIDMQLRPNGDSGLLVHSIQAFETYQREKAWVWEHQALTRARFVCGHRQIGQWFEDFRNQLLREPRDISVLRESVVKMRAKMYENHSSQPRLFDIKHDRGGIIDLEFIVQFLVLAYAHRYADLTLNLGNIALLRMSADFGLIPEDLANRARTTYREYRRTQHALRLNGISTSVVEEDRFLIARQPVIELWDYLFGGKLPDNLH